MGFYSKLDSAYADSKPVNYTPDVQISEIYNSNNNVFDLTKLNQLAKIIDSSATDFKSLVNNLKTQSTSSTLPAEKNASELIDGDGNTYTITLGGIKWIPVYFSFNTQKDSLNQYDPILTLWAATALDKNNANITYSYFNPTANSNIATNPSSNNYSTSYVRAQSLQNGGKYYVYNNGTDKIDPESVEATEDSDNFLYKFANPNGYLYEFIEQPNNIRWQTSTSEYATKEETSRGDLNFDTGLNSDDKGYYTNEWGNDKVWLPSLYEVCDTTFKYDSDWTIPKDDGGKWQLNNKQRACLGNSSIALRTPYLDKKGTPFSNAFFMVVPSYDSTRCGDYCSVTNDGTGNRPAIHLNLAKVAKNAKAEYDEPDGDITTAYDGKTYSTVTSYIDALATQPTWYDPAAPITYSITNGSVIKDVGTYEIKAYFTDTDSYTFSGTPETGEDQYTRYFNIIITKIKIDVAVTLDSDGNPIATCTGLLTGDSPPDLVLVYTDQSNASNVVEDTDIQKAKPSTYTVSARIKYPTSSNYEINSVSTCNYTKEKTRLTQPKFTQNNDINVTGTYSGIGQTFYLTNIDTNAVDIAAKFIPYGGSSSDAQNVTSSFNANSPYFVAVDAGTYNIEYTITDPDYYIWDDNVSTGTRVDTITMDRYAITLTFGKKNDTTSTSWVYGNAQEVWADGGFTGDTIELDFDYCVKGGSGSNSVATTTSGTTTSATMPNTLTVNAYTLTAKLKAASTSNDNNNYTLASGGDTWDFNVVGKPADDSKLEWYMTNADLNGGNPDIIDTSKKGSSTSSMYIVDFNDKDYVLSVNEAQLNADGIKVSITNSKLKDATASGNYYTSVLTLEAYDNTWDYNNGNPKNINFYWMINPKTLVIKVAWDYTSAFTYDTTQKTVALNGVVPDELEAVPDSTNILQATDAGTYSAGYTYRLKSGLNSSNYVMPTTLYYPLTWTINKKELDFSNTRWNYNQPFTYDTQKHSVEVVGYPTEVEPHYSGTTSAIDVKIPDPATPNDYDYTASVSFTLKSGYSANNYVVATQSNGLGFSDWNLAWTINKYEIKLDWEAVAANDTNGVEFKYWQLKDSLATPNGGYVTYGYYADEQCTTAAPLNQVTITHGEHYNYVKVELISGNSQNYALEVADGQSTFNPMPYSVGDTRHLIVVKSVTQNNTYDEGKALPVDVVCDTPADKNMLDVVYYKNDNGAKGDLLTTVPSVAGDYIVVLSVKSSVQNNNTLDAASNIDYYYTINRAEIDLSNVTWSEAANHQFTYTLENGAPKQFELNLVGLDATKLNGKESYTSSIQYVHSASDVGFYQTQYTLNLTDADFENYVIVINTASGKQTCGSTKDINVIYAAIPQSIDWEIVERKITKPVQIADQTFSGSDYDLIALSTLTTDDLEYITVTVTKGTGVNAAAYNDASGNAITKVTDADTYLIKFDFNSVCSGNVCWDDGVGGNQPVSITMKVNPLQVTLTGWKGTTPKPVLKPNVPNTYYKVEYKDAQGNDFDSATAVDGTYYFASVVPASGMEDNVIILVDTGVDMPKKFMYSSQPATLLTIPTLSQNVFEYKDADIGISNYVNDFDPDFEALSGDTTAKEVGSYSVTVSIVNGVYAFWQIGDNDTNNDITLTFDIVEAKIPVSWDKNGTTPVLENITLPSGAITYKYYDANDVEIAEADMVDGTEYTAVATLSSDYVGKYLFADTLTDNTQTTFSYTAPVTTPANGNETPSDGNGNNGNGDTSDVNGGVGSDTGLSGWLNGLPDNLPWWQIVVSVLSIILGIIFLIKIGNNVSATKNYKKKTEKTNERMMAAAVPTVALFGLGEKVWTVIALSLLAVAAVLFIIMLVTNHKRNEAKEEYETAREDCRAAEANRRDENMTRVLMAMGGNAQRVNVVDDDRVYKKTSTEDIEAIVTHVVTALLPNVTAQVNNQLPAGNKDDIEQIKKQQEQILSTLNQMKNSDGSKIIITNTQPTAQSSADEATKQTLKEHSEAIDELKKKALTELDDEEDVDEWSDEEEDFYDTDIEDEDQEIVPENKRVRLPSNFRVRLKISSDKCKDFYTELKNGINSYKGFTFRMSGRLEKVNYHGETIAMIGVVRKALKLWLALDPNAYDFERYHQKDASDKKRYEHVPMQVRIGSARALKRAEELLDRLLENYQAEVRNKYKPKNLQELAYTLKLNKLVKDKRNELLCQSIHVHDADVVSDEDAERYVEYRERAPIADENFAVVSLDTLDTEFLDGNKVTLDKLKKKGIIPEECNGYYLTAGKRLSKPLYVIADEISPSAVKMIVLTGGRVIELVAPQQTETTEAVQ